MLATAKKPRSVSVKKGSRHPKPAAPSGATGKAQANGTALDLVVDRRFHTYSSEGAHFHLGLQLILVVRLTHVGADDAS